MDKGDSRSPVFSYQNAFSKKLCFVHNETIITGWPRDICLINNELILFVFSVAGLTFFHPSRSTLYFPLKFPPNDVTLQVRCHHP